MHEFYNRVEVEFRRQGKSRNQFCKEKDIPYSSLQKYWDTDRLPQGDIIEKVAVFLNSSLDYLVFGKENKIDSITESIIEIIQGADDEQKIELRGIIRQFITISSSQQKKRNIS